MFFRLNSVVVSTCRWRLAVPKYSFELIQQHVREQKTNTQIYAEPRMKNGIEEKNCIKYMDKMLRCSEFGSLCKPQKQKFKLEFMYIHRTIRDMISYNICKIEPIRSGSF